MFTRTGMIIVRTSVVVSGIGLAAYLLSASTSETSSEDGSPRLALVVRGADPFWEIVIAGAIEAADEFDASLIIFGEDASGLDQAAVLEEVDASAFDGVAVSAAAPDKQVERLKAMASNTVLVTYDNDSPESRRHCYVGTNNVNAGRLCAELVEYAIPEGGKLALFVGDTDQINGRDRRDALIAALSDELQVEHLQCDDFQSPMKAGAYTIVGVYLDGGDPIRAHSNVEKALKEHPDVDGMVGLYGYNAPACLSVLKETDRLGRTKVIAFDQHEATLKGISDGHIVGAVVQDPFQYGYESVRLLCSLHRHGKAAIPLAGAGSIYLPCGIVTAENVNAYREQLVSRLQRRLLTAGEATSRDVLY